MLVRVLMYNYFSANRQAFFSSLKEFVEVHDLVHGFIKSYVFAVVIGVVSCHQGLQTIGGPRGIGRSVTKAVVNSIVLILILDYFLGRCPRCLAHNQV